ncbi:MAG: hypothetical protein KC668_18810 [Myxococcales bacterium]|nr:hypothetical protein [Myxococcales bacterium]
MMKLVTGRLALALVVGACTWVAEPSTSLARCIGTLCLEGSGNAYEVRVGGAGVQPNLTIPITNVQFLNCSSRAPLGSMPSSGAMCFSGDIAFPSMPTLMPNQSMTGTARASLRFGTGSDLGGRARLAGVDVPLDATMTYLEASFAGTGSQTTQLLPVDASWSRITLGMSAGTDFLLGTPRTWPSTSDRFPTVHVNASLPPGSPVNSSTVGIFPARNVSREFPARADIARYGFRRDWDTTTREAITFTPMGEYAISAGVPLIDLPISIAGRLLVDFVNHQYAGELTAEVSLSDYGVPWRLQQAQTVLAVDASPATRASCPHGAVYFNRTEGRGNPFAGTPFADIGAGMPGYALDAYVCSASDWLVEVSPSAGTIAGIDFASARIVVGPEGVRLYGRRAMFGATVEFEGTVDVDTGATTWVSTSDLTVARYTLANGHVALRTAPDTAPEARVTGSLAFGPLTFAFDETFDPRRPPSSITSTIGVEASARVLGVGLALDADIVFAFGVPPTCRVVGNVTGSLGSLSAQAAVTGSCGVSGSSLDITANVAIRVGDVRISQNVSFTSPTFHQPSAERREAVEVAPPPPELPMTSVALEPRPGFAPLGGAYGPPMAHLQGGYVRLSGAIRRTTGAYPAPVAILPENMRPRGTLIFETNHHTGGARVDVGSNGEVRVVRADTHAWVSLNGIGFTVGQAGEPLTLSSGSPLGASFEAPRVSGDDSTVRLQGAVRRSGSWGRIATLPVRYRPAARIATLATSSAGPVRVDINTDGAVTWANGTSSATWLSLSGIEFYRHGSGSEWTRNATPLTLASGVTAYTDANYRRPSVQKSAGVVRLSGFVRRSGATWGQVGTLPVGHRPAHQEIFHVTTHDGTARVDITPAGELSVVTGGAGYAMLSLSSIRFVAAGEPQPRTSALPLASGFSAYGHGYAPPRYTTRGTAVHLSGLVRRTGTGWGLVATLPPSARPREQLVFSANVHDRSTRVDVLPNGEVRVGASNGTEWVSLEGISYRTDRDAPALSLSAGFESYGGAYGTVRAVSDGRRVNLQGLVRRRGSAWGVIATLPPALRPDRQLIFEARDTRDTTRVDVLPNGEVSVAQASASDASWVSLSGIEFIRSPDGLHPSQETRALALEAGKGPLAGPFRAPSIFVVDDVVYLSGGLSRSRGAWDPVAELPGGWRPGERLVFGANSHDSSVRVDIDTEGHVRVITPPSDYPWVSLDGLRFVLP